LDPRRAARCLRRRSLYREPDRLWDDLSASYNKRNAIIHRGKLADEGDARLAIRVAGSVIEFARSIGPQPT